jgi:hypothetical protein
MLRSSFGILAALAMLTSVFQAKAFSILGSQATWMTASIGYQGNDEGGPMYLGDGYRWNIPVVTYAFDESFLTYFGSNGVAAVESAIKVLNNLPSADTMSDSLNEFPTYTLRHNRSAEALGLLDLKTYVLSYLITRMGVGAPERWVQSIRQFWTDPGNIQHFSVINLNYDPETWNPTSYINGVQYTYQNVQYAPGDNYTTITYPMDAAAPMFSTVAYYRQAFLRLRAQGGQLARAPGVYFPSLTREDVGSIRYLYRTKNFAVESVLPDVVGGTITGLSTGTPGNSTGTTGGGSSDETWAPTYQVAVGGGSGGTAWSVIVSSGGTNTTTGTTTGTVGATNSTSFISTALRPGIGKVTFAKITWDSLLSDSTKPYAITWTDRYVTNGVIRTQKLSRSVTRPDFLFSAGDAGTVDHIPVIGIHITTGDGFINNSALNRAGVGGAAGEQQGPGIINSFNELFFSKVGRYFLNDIGIGSTEDDASIGVSFGSFDGSTNAIIAYPDGASIRALEAQVLRSR